MSKTAAAAEKVNLSLLPLRSHKNSHPTDANFPTRAGASERIFVGTKKASRLFATAAPRRAETRRIR